MIINLCGGSGGGSSAPIKLQGLIARENGTYTPDEGYDGYSEVLVDVDSGGSTPINLQELTVNENGEYLPDEGYDGFNKVVVEVDSSGSGLDFSSIGYDTEISQSINDTYNADIEYSKQLLDEWDKNITDGNNLYRYNKQLVYVPNINTLNLTSMTYMFDGCINLTTVPNLNTINVLYMQNTFSGCISLKTLNLLPTSNVTTMSSMFAGCTNLIALPDFDTGKVNSLYSFLNKCSNIKEFPNINTSNVTNMGFMCSECGSLTTIPLLDCGKVTQMIYVLYGCKSLTNLGGFKDLKISVTGQFIDQAPNLTIESLMNVINNVYDLTANGLSGQSLKFGQTNLNKLTSEQIAVATAKGWTLTA